MGDVKIFDMMFGVLNCLFGMGYMGIIVENVVVEYVVICED